MAVRALTFGSVAAQCERFRPGYPQQVLDEVVAYAGRPISTALEIGAGTGKATRLFATVGIAVTATEPDPGMLAELRRHVPASVKPVQSTFEVLTASRPVDLVFAAAALHWTEAEQRWARVAALLAPGGVFAVVRWPVPARRPAPRIDRPGGASPVAGRGRHPGARWDAGRRCVAVARHGTRPIRVVHRRTPGAHRTRDVATARRLRRLPVDRLGLPRDPRRRPQNRSGAGSVTCFRRACS